MRAFATLRTLAYASAFAATWIGLAALARGLDPALGIAIPRGLRGFGLALALAGGALALACALWFALAGRGTPAPFDAPRVFVASGPYRFVRNPMYVGGGAALAGAGLWLGSAGIVLLAVAFFALAHRFVRGYEEPTLRERFGDSYREYCAKVGRWWPRAARRSP